MRKTIWAMALCMALLRCASTPPPPPPPPIDFKGELSRVGEWIVVAPYGRLWHPNPRVVGKDFVPYFTGGTWQYTPQGWSFKSKWDWGDLVFHHGRWMYVPDLDWLWSLDETEGVSFVQWKASNSYVGWAPIPPPVRGGGEPPPLKWTFVRARYFAQPEIDRFPLSHDDALRAPNETADVPRSGPAVEVVLNEGGLSGDAKTGYKVPTLPVPTPEPVAEPVAAPVSKVEVEVAPTAPPKKKKKKKTPPAQ